MQCLLRMRGVGHARAISSSHHNDVYRGLHCERSVDDFPICRVKKMRLQIRRRIGVSGHGKDNHSNPNEFRHMYGRCSIMRRGMM